jgi:hypothetical protein
MSRGVRPKRLPATTTRPRDFIYFARYVRLRRLLIGGSAANEHLTAIVASVLILLLTVEGATILQIRSLLTVHAFVGMLLIPVVAMKLTSTGWRAFRYYSHADDYVLRGPPNVVLRVLIAPVVVLSTLVLFGTGVALLALDQAHGTLVGLHKASFIVWVGATALHAVAHLRRLVRVLAGRLPGLGMRLALVGVTVTAGVALAVATLPAADELQDHVSAHVGVDER